MTPRDRHVATWVAFMFDLERAIHFGIPLRIPVGRLEALRDANLAIDQAAWNHHGHETSAIVGIGDKPGELATAFDEVAA